MRKVPGRTGQKQPSVPWAPVVSASVCVAWGLIRHQAPGVPALAAYLAASPKYGCVATVVTFSQIWGDLGPTWPLQPLPGPCVPDRNVSQLWAKLPGDELRCSVPSEALWLGSVPTCSTLASSMSRINYSETRRPDVLPRWFKGTGGDLCMAFWARVMRHLHQDAPPGKYLGAPHSCSALSKGPISLRPQVPPYQGLSTQNSPACSSSSSLLCVMGLYANICFDL